MDSVHHLEIPIHALLQPVPADDFSLAMSWAMKVWRQEAEFDTDSAEGMVVPAEPRDAPINRAVLALQHYLRQLGHERDVGAAAVHRMLSLMQTDLSAVELNDFMVRNQDGAVVGFKGELLAGVAQAPLDVASLTQPCFDPAVLAESTRQCLEAPRPC